MCSLFRGGGNLPGRAHLGLPALELRTARNGQATAVLAGVWLHSRYDPEQEARRYAHGCGGSEDAPPATVILLGGELGHVGRALSREFPRARLLLVYYHSELYERSRSSLPSAAAAWHPGSPEGLPQFLRRHLGESEAEGLRVLEWSPAARACPELSLEANRQVGQFLRELRGSLVTTAALGRRWLRNSFCNFVGLDAVAPLPSFPGSRPLVIAASGPSLAASLPVLSRHRRRFILWALPSAAPALRAWDLHPHLVVLTDPGYYAIYHLHAALPAGTPLGMPLSAGTGAWRLHARVSYFSQGTDFEREILATVGFRGPTVLPSGTVSASALELALQAASGPIVLAGLDFRFDDLHSHVRPNAVERLLSAAEGRLSPLHHRLFLHASDQAPRRPGAGAERSSLALDTYAGWFASFRPPAGRGLYRLHPSSVALPGLRPIDEEGFRRLLPREAGPDAAPPAPTPDYPPRALRGREALRIIGRWVARLEEAGASGQPALRALLADAFLSGLLYYCNAARLAELRRRLRLHGERTAGEAATDLLRDTRQFLQGIAVRLLGGL